MDNKPALKAALHSFQGEGVQTRPFWLDAETHIFLPQSCSLSQIDDLQMVNPDK